jgi:hypothetical protein
MLQAGMYIRLTRFHWSRFLIWPDVKQFNALIFRTQHENSRTLRTLQSIFFSCDMSLEAPQNDYIHGKYISCFLVHTTPTIKLTISTMVVALGTPRLLKLGNLSFWNMQRSMKSLFHKLFHNVFLSLWGAFCCVMYTYIFQIYTRDRNWEFIGVIFLLVHNMFRPLRAIFRWNTIILLIYLEIADKRRSLGRYSSLADSDHGVFFYIYLEKLSILQRIRCFTNCLLLSTYTMVNKLFILKNEFTIISCDRGYIFERYTCSTMIHQRLINAKRSGYSESIVKQAALKSGNSM